MEVESGKSVRRFALRQQLNLDELWSLNEKYLKSLIGTHGPKISMDHKLKQKTFLYLPALKKTGGT